LAAHDPAGAPSRTRKWSARARYAAVKSWATLKDYVVRVLEKADDDNVFLLASGLTFSVVAAAIPFLFILVSLISLTLEAAAEAAGVEPIEQLRRYLDAIVPVLSGTIEMSAERNLPEEVIGGVLNSRREIGLIGFVAFVWLSTRLFGSVRAILREIFDLRQSRGVIQGKIFDAQMVLVSSVLVILNIGITIVYNLVMARGFEFIGLSPEQVGFAERASAWFTALAFIFLLFLLLYKYVPARRVPWRMALTAAAFTAVCWEILKVGFTFYLTRVASYQSIYGGIATLVVVVVWFYYLSIVFVLGAEVAQVYEMRRVRRQQIEVIE
jgi:membrane protein